MSVPTLNFSVMPANAGIHVFRKPPQSKTWMAGTIGERSGLSFGKPKGELRDAVLSNGYGPAMMLPSPRT
jgi:hypothetical protein